MDSYLISAGVFIAFVVVPFAWQVIGLLARRKRVVRRDGYVYQHTPTGRIKLRKGQKHPHRHYYH